MADGVAAADDDVTRGQGVVVRAGLRSSRAGKTTPPSEHPRGSDGGDDDARRWFYFLK
jgi:hypothetical protein